MAQRLPLCGKRMSKTAEILASIVERVKEFKFHYMTVIDFSPCTTFLGAPFGKLKNTGVVKIVDGLFSLNELQSDPMVKRFMDTIETLDVGCITRWTH